MSKRSSFKKVVLVPGYQCNNRCVFCINSDKRAIRAKTLAELGLEMEEAAARGCDYIEFAGGENTIRPDFCALVRRARATGFKRIAVATNGRLFAYPEFARSVVDSGLSEIIFSVHGHEAALHDSLTGVKGSFDQLLKGVANMRRIFKGIMATNTAVTALNYRFLPEIGGLILEKFGHFNSEFIFADPNYGGVKKNFKKLMPRISDCAPYLRACLDLAAPKLKRTKHALGNCNWSARYVPLCHFQGYYPLQISEAREKMVYSNVQHVAPDYVNLDYIKGRMEVGRAKPPKCRACALYADCEGIWREYLRVYGDGELSPVRPPAAAAGKHGRRK